VVLSRQALEQRGFRGFVPFAALTTESVPPDGGIYVVVRATSPDPVLLATSTAGWRKGQDPAVSVDRLREKWVDGAEILYVGKADPGSGGGHGLRGRLRQYARHGAGGTSHHGGRYVWQLADATSLLVGWKPCARPRDEERALLTEFEALHGALPFANLKR
jgi:hypothetical protein